jgi:two-component system, chemotaxis family, chemotaxis protein CheY
MKILIVDDDLVSRKKMQVILKDYALIETAGDGDTAMSAFRNAWGEWKPFDLITLDISMPDMTGFAVLKKIRDIEKGKNVEQGKRVKVMMVTGVADRETVINCKVEGCDDYVVKPFKKETVFDKLHSMGFSLSETWKGT